MEFRNEEIEQSKDAIKASGSKGEFEPLSSLLVSQMQFNGKLEGDDSTLPLASELKLQEDEHKADCTILIGSLKLGKGEDDLGEKLMQQFFRALLHQATVPLHIIFLNCAVNLCRMDGPISRQLKALKELGTALHADRTSLQACGIEDADCLATPINSTGMAQLILESPRVITLP